MMDKMQSDDVAELFAALSAAQGELDHAKKDTANTFFKSKYATLAGVIDASKEALKANGLSVIQTTDFNGDGKLFLVTTLAHKSGQWIRGYYPINPIKEDPQGYGSAFTYARRYTRSAITGVAADDDDGNAASQPDKKQAPGKARKLAGTPFILAYEKAHEHERPDEEMTRINLGAAPVIAQLRAGSEDDNAAADMIEDARDMALERIALLG